MLRWAPGARCSVNGESAIRFERRVQTLLHARELVSGWEPPDLEQLAQRLDGRAELFAKGEALLSFDHPRNALRAALLLQRVGADTGRAPAWRPGSARSPISSWMARRAA